MMIQPGPCSLVEFGGRSPAEQFYLQAEFTLNTTTMIDSAVPESPQTWQNEVMMTGTSQNLPVNDHGFEPIGGNMGEADDDFTVTEIPAYLPCGNGEHLYLRIQKIGKSTLDVVKLLQQVLGVKESDIGYAGKKDAHAKTEQWLSIRTKNDFQDEIASLQSCDWLKIVEVSRHTNKLRLGHLKGNRFCVHLFDVQADDSAIDRACRYTESLGFINYFGKQRFGFGGANVRRGIDILRGGKAPHQLRILYVNAVQSAVFNLAAGRRFQQCGFDIFAGDVLKKQHGGCFICDDPQTDGLRSKNGEVSLTLAMPGKKTMHGRDFAESLERSAYQDLMDCWNLCDRSVSELNTDSLSRFADGDRREMWIRPEQMSFKRTDKQCVTIEFSLPSGTYATVLLRHLCGPSFSR